LAPSGSLLVVCSPYGWLVVLAEEKGKKGVRKYLLSRVDVDSSDGTGTYLTAGIGFWLCGQY